MVFLAANWPLEVQPLILFLLVQNRRQVPQLAQAGDGLASRRNRVLGGLRTRIA
jgi:hypothetical protein